MLRLASHNKCFVGHLAIANFDVAAQFRGAGYLELEPATTRRLSFANSIACPPVYPRQTSSHSLVSSRRKP